MRGPAQAVGCCACDFRSAKHLRRLESDAHWLAPVDIGHGWLERLPAKWGERRVRESEETESYERKEASIQRAQNFGKGIAGPDSENIWVPISYALNRPLVLGSYEEHHSVDGDHET